MSELDKSLIFAGIWFGVGFLFFIGFTLYARFANLTQSQRQELGLTGAVWWVAWPILLGVTFLAVPCFVGIWACGGLKDDATDKAEHQKKEQDNG